MGATDTLRDNLTTLGIDYGCLGDYNTRMDIGGLSWLVEDNLDGTMDATGYSNDLTPDEVMQVITGRDAAHVLTEYDDDGVGHSECGGCGRTVAEHMMYCPWCGARFTEIERRRRP